MVGLPAQVYQAKFEACPAQLVRRKALDNQEPMVMHHHLCPHCAGSDQQVTNRNFDSLKLVFKLAEWEIPEALQGGSVCTLHNPVDSCLRCLGGLPSESSSVLALEIGILCEHAT